MFTFLAFHYMLYCKNQGISLYLVIFRCVNTSKTDKLTNRQLRAIVVLRYSTSKAAAKLKTWGKMYTVWHISQLKDYLCFKSEIWSLGFKKSLNDLIFINETKTPIKLLHMKSSRQKRKYPKSKNE